MRIKLPSDIRLAGFEISVTYKEDIGHEGYRGRSYYIPKRAIAIDNKQDEQDMLVSLLHEVLHHIDVIYDCKLTESNIKRISHGIAEFIQQLEVEDGSKV